MLMKQCTARTCQILRLAASKDVEAVRARTKAALQACLTCRHTSVQPLQLPYAGAVSYAGRCGGCGYVAGRAEQPLQRLWLLPERH